MVDGIKNSGKENNALTTVTHMWLLPLTTKSLFLMSANYINCAPIIHKDMFEKDGFTNVNIYDFYRSITFDHVNNGNIVFLV